MSKKNKILLMLASILGFFASASMVLSPFFLGLAIDFMLGKNSVNLDKVGVNLSIALVFYGLNFIMTWVVSLISNHVAITYVNNLRTKIKEKYNKVPISYIDSNAHGKLQSHITNDGELVVEGLNQGINTALSGFFVIVISFIFMIRINLFMTLVTIGLIPVMYYSAKFITKKSLRLQKKQLELTGALSALTSEAIINHRLINTYSYSHRIESSFDEISKELRDVSEKAVFISALPNPTTRVINNIGYMLLGLSGAFAIGNFGLTVGMLTSFISYSNMFSKPFNELSSIVSQLTAAKAAHDRIQSILNQSDEPESHNVVDLQGDTVTFDNVSFGYSSNQEVIKDFSLHVTPQSKIAIVGPTGAGKSTLINLLMRFYDINKGMLYIDGQDTKNIGKSSVRNVISIVLQDPWLFKGTIRENIAYGKNVASFEQIVESAKQTGIHDYIISLEKGYDTMIEEGSRNISLGHKQLITIARALLMDSPIIILDEATSSLDLVSEYKIQQVFKKIQKERTSFFVAHRLNTVMDSDVILVMKEGRLVEYGNHEKLMESKGFYYQLFTSQY